ncbi:hypothetical protein D3C87_824080 [compost metagenome]
MNALFLKRALFYDVAVIKRGGFDFILWSKNSIFVKLLYYFKHEYFSFTKAL